MVFCSTIAGCGSCICGSAICASCKECGQYSKKKDSRCPYISLLLFAIGETLLLIALGDKLHELETKISFINLTENIGAFQGNGASQRVFTIHALFFLIHIIIVKSSSIYVLIFDY